MITNIEEGSNAFQMMTNLLQDEKFEWDKDAQRADRRVKQEIVLPILETMIEQEFHIGWAQSEYELQLVQRAGGGLESGLFFYRRVSKNMATVVTGTVLDSISSNDQDQFMAFVANSLLGYNCR